MAEDIDLFPLFSKVHTCGCLKHFFPRNVHLFSAKLWYDNTLCQGTINLPSFANDCLLKSSCNCILQGDEIIPHPPWEWKTLKTQGKPLKTQGTQFFGIFRILHCEKDPKKRACHVTTILNLFYLIVSAVLTLRRRSSDHPWATKLDCRK